MNTPSFKLYILYVCGFLFSILSIGIYWASIESNVFQGVKEMLDLRWGVVTFLDFYIGASIIGVWISVMEKSIFRGVIWTLCIYVLGNIVTLVYLIIRAWASDKFSEIFIPSKK
jgi:hypothetical protein